MTSIIEADFGGRPGSSGAALVGLGLLVVIACGDAQGLKFVEFPTALEELEGPAGETHPQESLLAVLADPDEFDGKLVSVYGALHLELEGDMLCLNRESIRFLAAQNCLWVRLAEGSVADSYDEIARWNGHYALVAGKINASDRGHFGLFRASIVEVSRIVVLASPGRDVPK